MKTGTCNPGETIIFSKAYFNPPTVILLNENKNPSFHKLSCGTVGFTAPANIPSGTEYVVIEPGDMLHECAFREDSFSNGFESNYRLTHVPTGIFRASATIGREGSYHKWKTKALAEIRAEVLRTIPAYRL